MNHTRWMAILDAYDEIDRMVENAAEASPSERAGAAIDGASSSSSSSDTSWIDRLDKLEREAPVGGADPGASASAASSAMARLHGRVYARLELLREALTEVAAREQVMLVLIIAFDERIMYRLPEEQRLHWPLLQFQWLRATNGGDVFFSIIDGLIADATTPIALFEVIYFALQQGFVGRFAGDQHAIEGYARQLRSRIPIPALVSMSSSASEDVGPGVGRVRSPIWYYASTALLIVVLCVALVSLSNCSL